MAVTAFLYAKAMLALANKEIDWNSDTIKVALCTSGYTPDQAAHDYFNDVTNEVAAGGGYAAGGATLGTPTAASSGNVATFDGVDTTWAASTITAAKAVIYDAQTGVAGTSPLIGWVDFGGDVSTTSGEFKITWNGSGIFTLTVA